MKKNTQWSRKFYVFYDKNDFVKCCGTADELVKGGFFNNRLSVMSAASKIKAGKLKGNVVVLR